METTKICTVCKQEKPLTEFSFRKDTNKYRNQCKECKSLKYKKYYSKNRDEILIKKREYRFDNIDKFKMKDKKYYEENSEAIKERRREYVAKNKDKIKQYKKTDSYKINERLYKHKRRAKIKKGGVTKGQIDNLIKNTSHCYWCGKDIKDNFHIDHYIPLSKGGEHTIENIVLTCPSCNLKKYNKDPREFAMEIGKLL